MGKCLIYHPFLNVRGGAEKVVESFLTSFTNLGYDIYILTRTSISSHESINKYFESNKEKIVVRPCVGSDVRFKGLLNRVYFHTLYYVNNLFVVSKCINSLKPKIIIGSCQDMQDIFAFLFSKHPIILYVHTPFWENLRLPYRILLKQLRSKMQLKKVFANSKFLARDLHNLLGVESYVLYPPYDDGFFKPNLEAKDSKSILMVGRVSPEKRIHLGIEAARELKKRDVDFKLNIVGLIDDKNYYHYLRELISRFDLKKNCEILPYGEAEVIRRYYQRSIAHWMFSFGYYGLTNVEAMACGAIPIVPPNCAELVVNGENGFVCSNSIEFADKTELILKNPKLAEKMAERAIANATNFTFSSFFEKLKDALESLDFA